LLELVQPPSHAADSVAKAQNRGCLFTVFAGGAFLLLGGSVGGARD
jgi:hypothetical protein